MLEWKPELNPLLCGLIILGLTLFLPIIYRRIRARTDRRSAVILMVPRILAFILVVIALLNPVITRRTVSGSPKRLLLLIDRSGSMSVEDSPDGSRIARAKELGGKLRSALPSNVGVDAIPFDTALRKRPASVSDISAVATSETDIAACLLSLNNDMDISGYSEILILSDGGDRSFTFDTSPPVPLSIVGIGTDQETWRDLRIDSISAPSSAEAGSSFEIVVDLRTTPPSDREFIARMIDIPVTLQEQTGEKWRPVSEQHVTMRGGRVRVLFAVSSEDTGMRKYRVVAPEIEGELSALNNTGSIAINVVRKKIRILYFTTEPGMGFRTVRSELARDGSVSFMALCMIAPGRFLAQGDFDDQGVTPPTAFPSDPDALDNYDCIILGSFPCEVLSTPQLRALVDYVADGGGLVIMGGEDSFGRGGYADSPLSPLFPWQLSPHEPPMRRGSFPVAVPPSALDEPVVESLATCRDQLSIDSVNTPGPLKPGAMGLLDAIVDGNRVPIMALQRFGNGTILAIASNTSWKWARQSDDIRDAYNRFLRQAVRSISSDAGSGDIITVRWNKDVYFPGDRAEAVISLSGSREYPPTLTATVTKDSKTLPTAIHESDDANAHTISFAFEERGRYDVDISATANGAPLAEYNRTFDVSGAFTEGSHLALDSMFLSQLADRTGGEYAGETGAPALINHISERLRLKTVVQAASLTRTGPWYALLILCVLVAEWLLRRNRNLI